VILQVFTLYFPGLTLLTDSFLFFAYHTTPYVQSNIFTTWQRLWDPILPSLTKPPTLKRSWWSTWPRSHPYCSDWMLSSCNLAFILPTTRYAASSIYWGDKKMRSGACDHFTAECEYRSELCSYTSLPQNSTSSSRNRKPESWTISLPCLQSIKNQECLQNIERKPRDVLDVTACT